MITASGEKIRDEGNLRARVDRLIGPLLKGRMPAGSRHTRRREAYVASACEGKRKMGAMERQARHLHWLVAFARSFLRSSRSIDHDRGDPRRAHRSTRTARPFRLSYDTFAG
jgi:uncharacterized membrane protein YccC